MTAPHLKLQVRHDPEDGWRLTATAASDTFSGRGRAWFDPNWLVEFADALGAFPIAAERPPRFTAGTRRDGKPLESHHEFVQIAIRPLTAKGLLFAQVGLGEVTYDHPDRWDYVWLSQMAPGSFVKDAFPYYQEIAVAFPVHYQAIADFASALRSLASGATEDATLPAAVF